MTKVPYCRHIFYLEPTENSIYPRLFTVSYSSPEVSVTSSGPAFAPDSSSVEGSLSAAPFFWDESGNYVGRNNCPTLAGQSHVLIISEPKLIDLSIVLFQ